MSLVNGTNDYTFLSSIICISEFMAFCHISAWGGCNACLKPRSTIIFVNRASSPVPPECLLKKKKKKLDFHEYNQEKNSQ